jgi:hypothetical protein
MSLRILACGVFRDALRYLALIGRHPALRLTYLPPALHNQTSDLQKELSRQIRLARQAGDHVLCLYGQCFPEMDDLLQEQRIPRVPGAHCYQMFLGTGPFQRVMEEDAGTYFLEKELILHFSEYCLQPLELHDPQMRQWYFQHYRRLLYIRQPLDPDLMPKARELADFLALHLMVMDADYSELKANLFKLIHASRAVNSTTQLFDPF